jgi:regulator of sigma E protease
MHLIGIPATILILGILVFIHELGHYLVAKWCGVRVETFSIGFGKRLWGFRRGETDYRISLLPLGGYVKMAGENPLEPRTGDPGEFASHPRWQRFLIAIAGPVMNIVFCIILLAGLSMYHNERPVYEDQPAVIGGIVEGSAAEKSGLQTGDRIVAIQEVSDPTWQQVGDKVILSPNQPIAIRIQRENQIIEKTVVPESGTRDPLGDMGWLPQAPTIVRNLLSDYPADKAGLRNGDEILALNNVPIHSNVAALLFLRKNKEKPIEITASRNGQQFKAMITPQMADDKAVQEKKEKRYLIGIALPDVMRVTRLPFTLALDNALDQTRNGLSLVYELVRKLIRGKIPITALESPVGMSRDAGDVAVSGGVLMLLKMMALISLQLGIFNLLPIPILDGGLMLLLLIEGTIRRDINQQIKERMYQVAFVCLILFASVVIFNDVRLRF